MHLPGTCQAPGANPNHHAHTLSPSHPPMVTFLTPPDPHTHPPGALMVETDLRGANLQEAVLTKAYAVRADLSGGCPVMP